MPLSYAVAIGYVLVDTYDKGHAAYLQAGLELDEEAKAHPDLNLPRCRSRPRSVQDKEEKERLTYLQPAWLTGCLILDQGQPSAVFSGKQQVWSDGRLGRFMVLQAA